MSGLRQGWLVARREMRERSRSRSFRMSMVVMTLSVVGVIVVPALLDGGEDTKDVGLAGTAPALLPAAIEAQGSSVGTEIRVHDFDSVASGEQAVRDGDVDVLVVDAIRLEWANRADEQLRGVVTGAIQLVAVRDRAAEAGISPDTLSDVVAPVGGRGQRARCGRGPEPG